MTDIAAASPSTAANWSLPPLSGRLPTAYRIIWVLLAFGSAATLAWLAYSARMETTILILRLCKGVVLLAVATILFRRRQSDLVAGLLSSAFLLWIITSSFDVAGGSVPLAVGLADRLRFLLLVLALLLFPNGEMTPAWARWVAIAACGVFVLGLVETVGAAPVHLFLPLAILCVLSAVTLLVVRYRNSGSMAERQQLKWIALGLVSGISLILATRGGAALNAGAGRPVIEPLVLEGLFQAGIIAIAIGFLVSLLRYRLYDAETVISRSVAYAALTLSLVAVFAGTEAVIEMFGQQYLGMGLGNISATMAAAVAAVLLSPLHGRITGWAEKRFQRDLAELKEQLPEFLAELSGISSTARVGEMALQRIESALYAVRTALVLDSRVIATTGIDLRATEHWLQGWSIPDPHLFHVEPSSPFALRMPLRCPFGSLRGWLLLGPRPDGTPFGRDDLDALTAIAPSLKRALFSAREREVERDQEHAEQRRLRKAIESLGSRLAAVERASDRT
ncbi:hypothetical protein [Sphingomonas alba]|uniref:Uncharacterized protein n=1 Tax=Sphingomonas alba TaxID=2908208 RepID=A0ABT0RND2_9SPHN|nr:hypothetical protein [Sphingomonas alba]MCL6684156.1 hypothetical protein [Sphingomonas alba]